MLVAVLGAQANPLGALFGGGSGVQKAATVGRTNTVTWLEHDASVTVWNVTQRVARMVGIRSVNAERMQVVRYLAGQECALQI